MPPPAANPKKVMLIAFGVTLVILLAGLAVFARFAPGP